MCCCVNRPHFRHRPLQITVNHIKQDFSSASRFRQFIFFFFFIDTNIQFIDVIHNTGAQDGLSESNPYENIQDHFFTSD